MIKVGDRLPEGFFRVKDKDGKAERVPVDAFFAGKRVVFIGVPGAFTTACHNAHIPVYVANADLMRSRGIDRIAVMAVNDHHVMKVWGEALKAEGKVEFLADGSADYTRALGLAKDLSEMGMGTRCQRFSMLVEDGVVKVLNLEPEGGTGITTTGAPAMLEALETV